MPSFLDDRVDRDAILEDIRNIVEIESPSRNAPGVNSVLETIARLFEGTGAAWERELTTDSLGNILLVRCDPTRNEPGILVLSHMDTVHPVGTLTGKLTYRREGDRVYGPGIYDMKGGLVLGVAAFRRIALARRRTKLPITFLFTPDEELSSPVSRSVIEREARGQRYVLVTEPSREGKVITERKGIGVSKYGRGRMHDRGGPAFLRPHECKRDGSKDQGPESVATRDRNNGDGEDHTPIVPAWSGRRSPVRQSRGHCKGDWFQAGECAARRRRIGAAISPSRWGSQRSMGSASTAPAHTRMMNTCSSLRSSRAPGYCKV